PGRAARQVRGPPRLRPTGPSRLHAAGQAALEIAVQKSWKGCQSKPIGDAQRVGFEQFKGHLLTQHHVARHQAALGEETPAAHTPAVAIELLDVHLPTVANAVTLARHAAGDVEVAVFFVLSALRNREVLLEQPNATLLRPLASDVGVHAP